MKKTDLAYFAGIIDGEGCITLAKNTKTSAHSGNTYYVVVTVSNTNEWLCQQLKFAFGGCFSTNLEDHIKWKPQHHWSISCNKAKLFLEAILPYLKLKKPQAELALIFISHKVRTAHVSQEYIDMEKGFKKRFSLMNKRGRIDN